jgi:hypothetical protein
MSFTNSRDHLSPQDPLYYAPPRLRRGPDFPSTPEPSSDRWDSTPSASGFDALFEEAVAESLQLPLDSEMVPAPPLPFERDGQRGVFGVAAGLAGALVAAALVAFLVVVMIPKSPTNGPAQLAAAENQTLLAWATAVRPNVSPEESQVLLQKFVQWQQRDGAEQQVAR